MSEPYRTDPTSVVRCFLCDSAPAQDLFPDPAREPLLLYCSLECAAKAALLHYRLRPHHHWCVPQNRVHPGKPSKNLPAWRSGLWNHEPPEQNDSEFCSWNCGRKL